MRIQLATLTDCIVTNSPSIKWLISIHKWKVRPKILYSGLNDILWFIAQDQNRQLIINRAEFQDIQYQKSHTDGSGLQCFSEGGGEYGAEKLQLDGNVLCTKWKEKFQYVIKISHLIRYVKIGTKILTFHKYVCELVKLSDKHVSSIVDSFILSLLVNEDVTRLFEKNPEINHSRGTTTCMKLVFSVEASQKSDQKLIMGLY